MLQNKLGPVLIGTLSCVLLSGCAIDKGPGEHVQRAPNGIGAGFLPKRGLGHSPTEVDDASPGDQASDITLDGPASGSAESTDTQAHGQDPGDGSQPQRSEAQNEGAAEDSTSIPAGEGWRKFRRASYGESAATEVGPGKKGGAIDAVSTS